MSRLLFLAFIVFFLLGAGASGFYLTILPAYDPQIVVPPFDALWQHILLDGAILASSVTLVLGALNSLGKSTKDMSKVGAMERRHARVEGAETFDKSFLVFFVILAVALGLRFEVLDTMAKSDIKTAAGQFLAWDILKTKEKGTAQNTVLLSNLLGKGEYTREELREMVEEYWHDPGALRMIIDRASHRFPPQLWFRLYEHEDENLRAHILNASVATRYTTLREMVERDILTGKETSDVIRFTALRTFGSQFKFEVFYALAADENEIMQLAVAGHYHTPQPLLNDFITAKNSAYSRDVKRAAFFNLYRKLNQRRPIQQYPLYNNLEEALRVYLGYNPDDLELAAFRDRYYEITAREKPKENANITTLHNDGTVHAKILRQPLTQERVVLSGQLPVVYKPGLDALFTDLRNFCIENVGYLFTQEKLSGNICSIPLKTLPSHYSTPSP